MHKITIRLYSYYFDYRLISHFVIIHTVFLGLKTPKRLLNEQKERHRGDPFSNGQNHE